jgi:beta-glucosidase
LVAVLTDAERVKQLVTSAPAIPRVGVPAYMWRNNILHGLVDNGISTQFPQATGLAATWDTQLLREVGKVCGTEQRAKHNIAVKFDSLSNDSPMNYGLDLWGTSALHQLLI